LFERPRLGWLATLVDRGVVWLVGVRGQAPNLVLGHLTTKSRSVSTKSNLTGIFYKKAM
jgi:hypothetical protein